VGANHVVEPGVMRGAANVKITLSIADQPFIQALESLLNAGSAKGTGLTYRLESGIYTITTGTAPPAPAGGGGGGPSRPVLRPNRVGASSKSRVTLVLSDKSLDEALRQVFDAGNVQFAIPLRVPVTGDVSMSMTNMPFEGALLGTLKAVDLGQPLGWQELGNGVYAIVPLPGGRGLNPETVRLSLNFHGAGLRDALSALFRAAGANFTIDQGVQSVPVTLKLHDVTLKAAAEMLLRSSGNPNYILTSEVGVYRVGVRAR
jgi:type II secretory pathway component GspD/PulD (secretin)